MEWSHHRLVFRLQSPLHVGYRKTANLMQTRRYVLGKALWAALTARVVRMAGQGNDGQAYREVGAELKKSFRFGYLWPAHATEVKGEWQLPDHPDLPWEVPEWDYLYLTSQARTALEPHSRTATEGMLYDVEFIASYTRRGDPVYLVGDLWVKTEALPESIHGVSIEAVWEQALQTLQLGGEQGYGWGRVRLETDFKDGQQGKGSTLGGHEWEENGGEVVISLKPDRKLDAHALAAGEGALPAEAVQGPVEVLVGWGWYGGRYGLSAAQVAYSPGGEVTDDIDVVIGSYGILQATA